MAERTPNNWERLEPPMAELDRDLREAMRGPAAPGELSDRIFEATVDDVLAGEMKAPLRRALAVDAPAGLAERIADATQPRTQPEAEHEAAGPYRWLIRPLSGMAVAAMLLLGVGLAIHFASPDNTGDLGGDSGMQAAGNGAASTELAAVFDNLEWALATNDDIRTEVSALAADIDNFDNLADMESDAAIEDELTRQLYYYELADAQAASF